MGSSSFSTDAANEHDPEPAITVIAPPPEAAILPAVEIQRRWSFVLLLILTGLALLLLSSHLQSSHPTATPVQWSPLPTRAPTATPPGPDEPLAQAQVALLAGDLKQAERWWREAQKRAPNDGAVLLEGARLALRRGDLDRAERLGWAALKAAPQAGNAWALLGEIANRRGEAKSAADLWAVAQSLDPQLRDDLFTARWVAARRAHDTAALRELAQQRIIDHPNDPLLIYYRAEALLQMQSPRTAIDLLLLGMEGKTQDAAVLWYTLGRAYLMLNAPDSARIALEEALLAFRRGDTTLYLATDEPERDINEAIARAYILSRRCDLAAERLAYLVTPYPDLAPLWEKAAACPTPTPTPTPWLPADWALSPDQR